MAKKLTFYQTDADNFFIVAILYPSMQWVNEYSTGRYQIEIFSGSGAVSNMCLI